MHLEIIICSKRISSWKILKSSFSSCPCLFLSYNPISYFQVAVRVALLRKGRAMRNIVRGSCPVRCMVRYCQRPFCCTSRWSHRSLSPLLERCRVLGRTTAKDVGWGGGGTVCVGRDILNRMLTWSGLSGENEIMLIHRNTIMLWLRGPTVWGK